MKRVVRQLVVLFLLLAGCGPEEVRPGPDGAWHVYPGEEIQVALDRAAADPQHKHVVVHEGTYRPARPAQALIWLHRDHDGLLLEASGQVVLTAANPDRADRTADSFPAIVNHVVYFGDGISARTVLRGFTITGANGFQTRSDDPGPVEPNRPELGEQNLRFFYCDGGGIKVFGRSYPRIERVEVLGNMSDPCGAGISIQHLGFQQDTVRISDSIFRDNRCTVTGSAIDVLPASSAEITNCLFVDNLSNIGEDTVSPPGKKYNAEHGSGALTVFPDSRVRVTRCTFTGNWNGVDDKGPANTYERSIFWQNTRPGGRAPRGRYELDLLDGSKVRDCLVGGATADLRGTIDAQRNRIDGSDPDFDSEFRPQAPDCAEIGYRPVKTRVTTSTEQH